MLLYYEENENEGVMYCAELHGVLHNIRPPITDNLR